MISIPGPGLEAQVLHRDSRGPVPGGRALGGGAGVGGPAGGQSERGDLHPQRARGAAHRGHHPAHRWCAPPVSRQEQVGCRIVYIVSLGIIMIYNSRNSARLKTKRNIIP